MKESRYQFVLRLRRLDEMLSKSASADPTRALLRTPDRNVTYGEADDQTTRFACHLQGLGLAPGERVAILAENGLDYVVAFYGAMRAGLVAVPVNNAVDASGLRFVLGNSGATILCTTSKFRKVVSEAADSDVRVVELAEGDSSEAGYREPNLDPAAPAAIIYTSGSTGEPRGATLSHRNLLTNTWSILEYLELTEDDRMMVVLPFYYVYGQSLLNTHIAVGASLIIGTELFFPNRVIDRMKQDEATGLAGVPSSFVVLMSRSSLVESTPPTLRYLTQAGGAMSPDLTRQILEGLPNVDLFIMYGATEAGARLSYLEPSALPAKIGSIGKAIPGVTLRVLREDETEADVDEPGELVASGDNIMLGYWNDPEETGRVLGPHGLRTGDLARRDHEGYLYIVGRKKEMIKSGAHRISPKEIEEHLAEHPDVLESAVIGVPDELLGEAIVAFVVLVEGSDLDERGAQRFLMEHVAEYKVPRYVRIVSELPKNESGKVQKRTLKDRELDSAPREDGQ